MILLLIISGSKLPFHDMSNEVYNILWAEAANDPEGWNAKLNTYNKMRRGNETLEDTMKRVSSAYRTKSEEYKKASSGKLNAYEKKVMQNLQSTVDAFMPDPEWKYIHHENYDLPVYRGMDEASIDQRLLEAWGDEVDFQNKKKIGREYYMPRK